VFYDTEEVLIYVVLGLFDKEHNMVSAQKSINPILYNILLNKTCIWMRKYLYTLSSWL